MNNLTLCLHKGAQQVDRKVIAKAHAPMGTDTWRPVRHELLISTAETALAAAGYKVTEQVHGLARGGNRYFGLMQIQREDVSPEFGWVLGLRNSHDKSFPSALAAGSRVFVCDNLAFTGDVRTDRRHTKHIERDLPGIVTATIGKLSSRWNDLDKRYAGYKDRPLTDQEAHDLIIQCLDARAIGIQKVPLVLKEYRKPSHEEFAAKNVWSLFNAVTEIAKRDSVFELGSRTEALHGVMDSACGLVFADK